MKRWIHSLSRGLLLVVSLSLLFARQVQADDYTIKFDDLPTGELVTAQYLNKPSIGMGVEFLSEPNCTLPVIANDSRAPSGPQVASIPIEFPVHEFSRGCVWGHFNALRRHVRVMVGYYGTHPGAETGVTLWALDKNKMDIPSLSQFTRVQSGAPYVPLELTSSSANIAYFAIVSDTSGGDAIAIDDLSFDLPTDPQRTDGPSCKLTSDGQLFIPPVVRGSSRAISITVHRSIDWTGSLSLVTSAPTTGVTPSFWPSSSVDGPGDSTIYLDLLTSSEAPVGTTDLFRVTGVASAGYYGCSLSLQGLLVLRYPSGLYLYDEAVPTLVEDVSPDARYGALPAGIQPSGRALSIVADPPNVYVATSGAGVWKSTNSGVDWSQSSKGLKSGLSAQRADALAIDEQNPLRLIYATNDDLNEPDQISGDGKAERGGLYVTTDAAANWTQVILANCPRPEVSHVVFSAGRAFAPTRCNQMNSRGIATSADLVNWEWFSDPRGPAESASYVEVAVGSGHMFLCRGQTIWRSRDLDPATSAEQQWSNPISLTGNNQCWSLANVPDQPGRVLVVQAPWASGLGSPVDVEEVDFTTRKLTSLHFADNREKVQGSSGGWPTVHAPRRKSGKAGGGAGDLYDIFASDSVRYFQYVPGQNPVWKQLPTSMGPQLHVDTWGMAFAANYDPANGRCQAYVGNDGGVFTNFGVARGAFPTPCVTKDGDWVTAEHGLHNLDGETMAGFTRSCDTGRCTTLWVPSGDNDTWISDDSGADWSGVSLSGDEGKAMIDPALPGVVSVTRNNFWQVLTSNDGNPPTATNHFTTKDIYTSVLSDGGRNDGPPGQQGFSQIMTLRGELPSPYGDYVAIAHRTLGDGKLHDVIVRNKSGDSSGWEMLLMAEPLDFPRTNVDSAITNVAPSGGHDNPTIYILLFDGTIRKLVAHEFYPGFFDFVSQDISIRPDRSKPNINIGAIFADPYDPRYLYASSVSGEGIWWSDDGGADWQKDNQLWDIATRNGQFRFGCSLPEPSPGVCSLNQMVFDRDHPDYRFAVLPPGGVAFSRDKGNKWIYLKGATDLHGPDAAPGDYPFTLPYSAFYDGADDLYVTLLGGGVLRVNAPFATLVGTAPVPIPPRSWTGNWNTTFGLIHLTTSGFAVTGTYDPQGRITGRYYVGGWDYIGDYSVVNTLHGTWSQAPSHEPPNDAGDVELTLAEDGRSFIGRWRYGSSGDWSSQPWNGTRAP